MPQPPLEHGHHHEAIRQRLADGRRHNYLRDWVYGGMDGTVTTFAVVSGVAGADLGLRVVLILGLANLVADGFSMAAGNYVGTLSERDEIARVEAIEQRHIDVAPDGERNEVRQIFQQKGLSGDVLDQVVEEVTADRERWVRTMVTEEYGLPREIRSPGWAAATTFSAFVVCGAVPLLPFILGVARSFTIASLLTAVVFLAIGAFKGLWDVRPWWRSSIETLAIGGAAAVVAYSIGAFLKGVA